MVQQIWTPQRVYEFLKVNYLANELLSRLLPPGEYCTQNLLWSELLVAQTQMPTLDILENLACVANRLQGYRDTLFGGTPVIITSAWRAADYNKQVGGAPQSKHLLGQAIDFCSSKLPPSKVQILLAKHSGGLGAYKNFTHIDISDKRRWIGAE